MQLQELAARTYARDVLPQTAELWAGRRDLDTYVAHTVALARSGYGRKHYRTYGFFDGQLLVASFKRHERLAHDGPRRLRAFGIGAVFTPAPYRGRGYASAMLASALDRARSEGYDLAYLFSDIHPQFYEALGFVELPSREFSLRADSLPKRRIEVARLEERDWSGLRRCFDLCERRRTFGFTRTPLVWEGQRLRRLQIASSLSGAETNLVVRRGRGVAAYVLGVREPGRDAYVVDEFGFADDEAAGVVPALLRSAAGDLRRLVGWLPPSGTRELLPRGSVRRRKGAILMMAPLSKEGLALVKTASRATSDFSWETDHI
ncbi:MAG TPA: GNAT family N-acetyltransferase [Verrucomicrobiae bacterium]|nr:GNAT family N-acetyltransferase [Verrucomicrobiae bacterium]